MSALGHNLIFRFNGAWMRVGGTSASGPIAAGVVSSLNNLRLLEGKAPLGWLNPLLYGVASTYPFAFRDVVVGENSAGDVQPRGSPYASFCPGMGYYTKPGWDPVTGLGSMDFKVWAELIRTLP